MAATILSTGTTFALTSLENAAELLVGTMVFSSLWMLLP
jgi:hypothetical protein